MISPFRIFLLGLYIAAILAVLMALVDYQILPSELSLSSEYKLKLPSFKEIFQEEQPEYANIKAIQDKLSTPSLKTDSTQKTLPDSTSSTEENPEGGKSIDKTTKIQYPNKQDTLLYTFFRGLENLETKKGKQFVRVVHYGDSQLEGDRITSFLRNKFQERFGGCGAGMQGLSNRTNSKYSILQQNDPQWQLVPMFGRGTPRGFQHYGMLANTFRMTGQQGFAWFFSSRDAHFADRKTENIKIIYRNTKATFSVSVLQENELIKKDEIVASEQVGFIKIPLTKPFKDVRINFDAQESPEIYGISLDCNEGITFDNVPIRGSSGLEFSKINTEHLAKQFKDMDVKFVILQFGVNVTPNAKDYTFYEKALLEQLLYFKRVAPQVSVLVVGTSDRSFNKNGKYISYNELTDLRDAQRRASFKAGCAFWDLYEVMGGKNSMPSWVKESLASPDYTHFTPKGAALVGEILYESLLYEYEKFKKKGFLSF